MSSNSITITNHTNKTIEITTIQDALVAEGDRKKKYTIDPKDTYVIFTDRVEALSWEKSKQG